MWFEIDSTEVQRNKNERKCNLCTKKNINKLTKKHDARLNAQVSSRATYTDGDNIYIHIQVYIYIYTYTGCSVDRGTSREMSALLGKKEETKT